MTDRWMDSKQTDTRKYNVALAHTHRERVSDQKNIRFILIQEERKPGQVCI